MKTWCRRDLTIISGFGGANLVIACDSCGGIGGKPGDSLRLPPYYAGKFAARVGLTEVICSGASPVAVTNAVSNEMNPTGAEIICGISDELKTAGYPDIALTGSTEENFATIMTAVGITVIGAARDEDLRFHKAESGDVLLLLGLPVIGAEVDLNGCGFYNEIKYLLSINGVREIVPVGSKGITYEAETLAALNGLSFVPSETEVDLLKSAGPVTCVLALCGKADTECITSGLSFARRIGEYY